MSRHRLIAAAIIPILVLTACSSSASPSPSSPASAAPASSAPAVASPTAAASIVASPTAAASIVASPTAAASIVASPTAAASSVASPSAAASSAASPAGTPGTKFKGISVNILTFNGPQIAEPLQRRAPDWEQATGGHVNVVAVGFQTIYDKALLDASTGTNSFDGYVFDPQWLGDFVGPGYLLDLTDRVTADAQLDWQDIGPFFRDFNATYNGKVYTIPLDGDFHMVYYRSDLLAKDGLKPPATWDDYMTIAQKYQGQDLNGDGEPDYGSCIAKKKGAAELLVDHLDRSRSAPEQGDQRGRVLRYDRHDPAVRTERGHDQGARHVRQDGHRRSARRAEHGCRWDARSVHHRPVRAVNGLGRHRDADSRHLCAGQDRRHDHAGLEADPRPLDGQARCVRRRRPARTRSTASTTLRSPRSAAGRARSTRPHQRRTRTPSTTSSRT